MKKNYFLLIIICLSTVACKMASYTQSLDSTTYGVDYREGKWLLNTIDCPLTIEDRIAELSIKHFEKKLGKNFRYAEDDKSIAISYIPIFPDSLQLKQVKKQSKSDYLINIKCETITDNLGMSNVGHVSSKKSNVAKTTLQIYDLNTLETIYSRTITGSVYIDENDTKDFRFVKSANGMLITGLKKILGKID